MTLPLLSLILVTPVLASVILAFSKNISPKVAGHISLIAVGLTSLILLFIGTGFNFAEGGHQYIERLSWIPFFNIEYYIGIDSLSYILCWLAAGVFAASFTTARNEDARGMHRLKYACLLLSFSGTVGVFIALDAVLFYLFWELAVFPTFLQLVFFSEGNRRSTSLKFILYSLCSSVLMLAGFVIISVLFRAHTFELSFNLLEWSKFPLPSGWLVLTFSCLFVAFAVKSPIFPFHGWMPDTYVKAPMSLTIVLSGILSKLGVYGIMRLLVPMFGDQLPQYFSGLMWLAVLGAIYASLIAMTSKDPKKVLAFSSMAHIGIILFGFFSLNPNATWGAIFQTFNHGVISVALFFGLDVISQKFGSDRRIGGVWSCMPVASAFFILFALAGTALPGTATFVGELSILAGAYKADPMLTFIATVTTIFAAAYMLNIVRSLIFGPPSETVQSSGNDLKLSWSEKIIFCILAVLVIYFGIHPAALDYIFSSDYARYAEKLISFNMAGGKFI